MSYGDNGGFSAVIPDGRSITEELVIADVARMFVGPRSYGGDGTEDVGSSPRYQKVS